MDFALAGYVVSVVLLYGLCCGWLCCLCCGGFVDSDGLVMLYWLCGVDSAVLAMFSLLCSLYFLGCGWLNGLCYGGFVESDGRVMLSLLYWILGGSKIPQLFV